MEAAECYKLSDGVNGPLWMFWKRRRYVVVFMAFLGFANVYTLRVNLSVAIVAMTELREVVYENGTIVQEQTFEWSSSLQGYILSSFFYGYVFTQVLGGYLSNKLGGTNVFGVGIGGTAILTLLTPMAAQLGVGWLIAIRVLEGFLEGVTFPCSHAFWSRWAPPSERSRMASIACTGAFAGTVLVLPISGMLVSTWGWESVFYFFGVVACIWYVAWIAIVRRSPEDDKYITEQEKHFIVQTLKRVEGDSEETHHPWKKMLTSKAVISMSIASFTEDWGYYTLLTGLPTFLKSVLGFDLQASGFISALPYLLMGILLSCAGYVADWLQIRGYLTTTQVRKYFTCGGFTVQLICMMIGAWILRPAPTIVCITTAVGFGGVAWNGYLVNPLDLSPRSAGVLMGISNGFATIAGVISPIVNGYITTNNGEDEWRLVFYITAGIYIIGTLIYWFWGSGELQPWSVEATEQKTNTNNYTKTQ
ncbi:vesicular glutamate transporter 2-like [Wyeomyia smithii]|uniref:vesicular glutamate transporter 2-like n=1 Tax=Wyeomyia smithii TaxID=174621 RepID=UPI0024681487|nr:vesicular glutamate transporter 2-like [Wyeomyia smithii]